MGNLDKPPALLRYGGFLLFALLALGTLTWFGWSMYQTITQIGSNASIISFNKGIAYMLGAGIGLSVLTYGILHEVILGRSLSKKVIKNINTGAIISVLTLLIFPQLIHYSVDHVLNGRDYKVCDQASYRWLFYRNIVYVSSTEECETLAASKN